MTEPTPYLPRQPQRRRAKSGGLYGEVVDRVGEDIVTGKIAAGSIIYADQISQSLGVSRSVVRESMRTLESMGLVEARPQVGTRVLGSEHWDLLNPRVVSWRAKGNDYLIQQRELLELRLGLEATAAKLAAERISDEKGDLLVSLANAMGDALVAADPGAYFDADADFHRVLVEESGNAVISRFGDIIEAVLEARSTDNRPEMSRIVGESVRRHIALAEAVRSRNPVLAEKCAYDIVEETLHEFEPFTLPAPPTNMPARAPESPASRR